MTKKQILLGSFLIATGMFSCKQKSYTKLPSGLEYMIVKDEKGDKKPALSIARPSITSPLYCGLAI